VVAVAHRILRVAVGWKSGIAVVGHLPQHLRRVGAAVRDLVPAVLIALRTEVVALAERLWYEIDLGARAPGPEARHLEPHFSALKRRLALGSVEDSRVRRIVESFDPSHAEDVVHAGLDHALFGT